LWMDRRNDGVLGALGRGLVYVAPWLMKVLGVVGTIAMFLVGGGIFVHNMDALHHLLEVMERGGIPALIADILASLVVGVVVGAVVVGAVTLFNRMRGKSPAAAH